MDSLTAFAAIGLTAVTWDGSLTPAGGRAFRHALDYREPYCSMSEGEMIEMMDALLQRRRQIGNEPLMLEAAQALSPTQSLTAYAMASELMRSDGPYEAPYAGPYLRTTGPANLANPTNGLLEVASFNRP